jgi:hypothetical protein
MMKQVAMSLTARHLLSLLGLDSQCCILVMLMTDDVMLYTACTALLKSKDGFQPFNDHYGAACAPQPGQSLPYYPGSTGSTDTPKYICEQYVFQVGGQGQFGSTFPNPDYIGR